VTRSSRRFSRIRQIVPWAVAVLMLVAPLGESSGKDKGKGQDALAPIQVRWNDVAASGTLAYFARGDGVLILDFADPSNPVEVGRLELRTPCVSISIDGEVGYLSTGTHGLYRLDLSDPLVPTLGEHFETPGSVREVATRDALTFVADRGYGLRVVDYSYRGRPRQVAFESSRGQMEALDIVGDTLATAEGEAGVRLFDISSGKRPKETHVLHDATDARDVAIMDDLVLVATGRGGLLIYRWGDRGRVNPIGSLETRYPARRISRYGKMALLSYGSGGVDTIDLTDPSRPRIAGGIKLPRGYPVWRFAQDGERIYVASLESGFGLVDLSNPTEPVTVLPTLRPMKVTFR
jgi:hypothetical protein